MELNHYRETETVVRKTYPQNWALYNLSQTKEKLMFLKILNDAVDYLEIPYEYKGNGRPPHDLRDMIKCCCIKVFNNFSSRRTVFELQMAYALGYISRIPHFNSVNNYLNNSGIQKYFEELYKLLASPMIQLENNFAVDATGFSTLNKNRWMDLRFGKKGNVRDYKKLHIVSGVRTNIITSARITKASVHDTKCFPELVKETSLSFKIREICADGGYLSRKNCSIAQRIGAQPFILPRIDTRARAGRSSAWHKMIRLWEDNRELFAQHYHQRSNVESTFSMIKRKFLGYVRSKTDLAIENEILCKVICHNASVLVNTIFEFDIDLSFDG